MGGSAYLITFTDRYSRLMMPYGIRRTSDVPLMVQRFVTDPGAPGFFRSDNGGEFASAEYTSICDRHSIRRVYTGAGTPK